MLTFHHEKMKNYTDCDKCCSINFNLDDASFRHHLARIDWEIRGIITDGMEKRIHFDPADIPLEVARQRLSEVIKLEARTAQTKTSRRNLRRPEDTSTG